MKSREYKGFKLFLTSWPHGRLRLVDVLGPHKSINGAYYIRYQDGKGGTDTVSSEYLFDIPQMEARDEK